MRVGVDTLTMPPHGGMLVGPGSLRQIFNDTDDEALWLIVGAPDREFSPGEDFNLKPFYPEDSRQLPKELTGVRWPSPDGPTGLPGC
ncbi:MAG: hypothetical protein ACREFX_11145 [Opitutaceae bacterium]